MKHNHFLHIYFKSIKSDVTFYILKSKDKIGMNVTS